MTDRPFDLSTAPIYRGPVPDRRYPGVVAAFRDLVRPDRTELRVLARVVAALGADTEELRRRGDGSVRIVVVCPDQDAALAVAATAAGLGWRLHPDSEGLRIVADVAPGG